eukprot:TRINITY_DN60903_c0_g1_i1.p1 TRINITY_DN60903_c0_g1~~TRINITY_DN60903_c0_g1_i1.p1  ORF type:complete len:293 (+),score=43.35 TRINITY_DN60903_c0_g1_i1:78-956(+)
MTVSHSPLAILSSHSWNSYRYVGDTLHDAAVVVLLCHVWCTRSVGGLSKRTQLLYLFLFIARYLDLLDHSQTMYLVAHKLFFISSAALLCLPFFIWKETYEAEQDTCPAGLLMIVACAVAGLMTMEMSFLEFMWTLSQMTEAFALVPQYVFCYRDAQERLNTGRTGILLYILCMGFYRLFYMLNWLHKKRNMTHYWDPQSWLGGGVATSLFVDFLLFRCAGASCLRRITLGIDDGLQIVGAELREKLGSCLLGPGERGHQLDVVRVPGSTADLELQRPESAVTVGAAIGGAE